jgi:DUF177 domain-containing protein
MLVINVSKIPPEGQPVDADLDPGVVHLEGEDSFVLESGHLRALVERGDDDTVHVRGHLAAELGLQCGRCLDAFPLTLAQELDLFYLPHHAGQAEEEEEVELSDRDVVVAYYQGDRLDLGDVIREQLFLAAPLSRLCREDCRGLCPTCGTLRNQADCGCPPVVEESRSPFAVLKGKLGDGSSS